MTARLIDISFPLDNVVLSIRVEKEDRDSALSDTLADAQRATSHFAKAPDQTKVTASAYTSLGGVVDSLSKLMEIADSAAQVRGLIPFLVHLIDLDPGTPVHQRCLENCFVSI